MCVCVCVCEVAQLCLALCDPLGCSPPGSSVHGILQARVLEWVVISFSRDFLDIKNFNLVVFFFCNHKKEHINKHFFPLKFLHILSLILLLDSELSVTTISFSLVLCSQEHGG